MRISKPSIRSAGVLFMMGVATAALAQVVGSDAPRGDARQSAAEQGQTAMDRLERAIAREKADATNLPDPRLPRTDNPVDQRRAFEGLRKRMPAPEMEARARAAQAKGSSTAFEPLASRGAATPLSVSWSSGGGPAAARTCSSRPGIAPKALCIE